MGLLGWLPIFSQPKSCQAKIFSHKLVHCQRIKGVPSAESSRSVRGLGKGVSGKPYPRQCNAGSMKYDEPKMQNSNDMEI